MTTLECWELLSTPFFLPASSRRAAPFLPRDRAGWLHHDRIHTVVQRNSAWTRFFCLHDSFWLATALAMHINIVQMSLERVRRPMATSSVQSPCPISNKDHRTVYTWKQQVCHERDGLYGCSIPYNLVPSRIIWSPFLAPCSSKVSFRDAHKKNPFDVILL